MMIFKLANAWMRARGGEGSTYAGLAVVGVWLESQTSIDFAPLLDVVPEIIAGVTSGNWLLALAPLLLAVAAIIKTEMREARTIEGEASEVNHAWTRDGALHEPQPQASPPMPPRGPPNPQQPQGGPHHGS